MKVRDLVAALSKLEPDLDVLCYTEDEGLVAQGRLFALLDINGVDVSEAERCRVDAAPYLKLGKTERSERLALIDVTTDF